MDISKVEPGNEDSVNVFTETEKGSKSYYKYNKESGMFMLQKVLKTEFPGTFGFVPKTHHVDGESLDVLILVSDSIQQGIVVQARPIGIVRMRSQIPDEVLVAVSIADEAYDDLCDLSKVDDATMKSIKAFLEEFKGLKVENILDSKHARNAVRRSIELYEKGMT